MHVVGTHQKTHQCRRTMWVYVGLWGTHKKVHRKKQHTYNIVCVCEGGWVGCVGGGGGGGWSGVVYFSIDFSSMKPYIHTGTSQANVFFFSFSTQIYWYIPYFSMMWVLLMSTNNICFNSSLAEHDMSCLSKQCRSRSVGFCRSQLICIYTH